MFLSQLPKTHAQHPLQKRFDMHTVFLWINLSFIDKECQILTLFDMR